jgi:hypothetical protein
MHYMPYIIGRTLSSIARMRNTARPRYLVAALLALSALAGALSAGTAAANSDQRCFAETGFCISGRIRTFWEQNGGLTVFGLPIGPQHEELVEGRALQVQRFERNRLELHPDNQRPYDVELGRVGDEVLVKQGRDWRTFQRAEGAAAGCRFFAETGHSLCEPFLSYWRGHGLDFDGRGGASEVESLALFGLPLGEPQVETNSSGDSVLTQWFERARFERHERNPVDQQPLPQGRQVLLGRLGAEAGDEPEHPTATPCNPERNPDCHREEPTPRPTEQPHEPTATPCDRERNDGCEHREPPHHEPTATPCNPERNPDCHREEPTPRPTEGPHEPTATPCDRERNDGCEHHEPTARPTEQPHEPTPRPTEPPHEPTPRPTERPHEPTPRPTEPPHEPTATPRR